MGSSVLLLVTGKQFLSIRWKKLVLAGHILHAVLQFVVSKILEVKPGSELHPASFKRTHLAIIPASTCEIVIASLENNPNVIEDIFLPFSFIIQIYSILCSRIFVYKRSLKHVLGSYQMTHFNMTK